MRSVKKYFWLFIIIVILCSTDSDKWVYIDYSDFCYIES